MTEISASEYEDSLLQTKPCGGFHLLQRSVTLERAITAQEDVPTLQRKR